METIFSTISEFGNLKPRYDDDPIDRVNHSLTGIVLVIFSIVVTSCQYVGNVIECYTKDFYAEDQQQFIDNYCWISNTWWQPLSSNFPTYDERREREILYYQYVPFFFLIQAFFFYLPCLLWRLLADLSSVPTKAIVRTSLKAVDLSSDIEKKTKIIEYLAGAIKNSLDNERNKHKVTIKSKSSLSKMHIRKRIAPLIYGRMLFCFYIFIKLVYIANAFIQLYIVNLFLMWPFQSGWYGMELLRQLANGYQWDTTGIFPRIVYCDLEIYRMGHNIQRHTVQCVLPINMFNEKIFIFLFFWFLILFIISGLSLILWIFDVTFAAKRDRFVRKYIPKDDRRNKVAVSHFIHNYLGLDGVFILTLIKRNTGAMIIKDIIQEMWSQNHSKSEKQEIA